MKRKFVSLKKDSLEQCYFCKKNHAQIYTALTVTLNGDQLQNGNMIVWENLKIKVPRCKKCMKKMAPNWSKILKLRAYILGIIISIAVYAYLFYYFFHSPQTISMNDAFIIWLCPVTLIIGIGLADLLSGYIISKIMKSFWATLPDIKNFSKVIKLLGEGWRLQN